MRLGRTHRFTFATDMLDEGVGACAGDSFKRRPSSDLTRLALFLELGDNSR
jgi:hypothetical protein